MAFVKQILILSLIIGLSYQKPFASRYNKVGQVVFLGDSITDFWRNDGLATWDQFYEPLGAVNTGVSGDTSADMINRINSGMIDDLHPYQAVLKIGTNDLARGVSEETLLANIETIIGLIQAKSPGVRIILLGILPRGEANLHQQIRNVNNVLTSYADDARVFFMNMESQFSTGLGQVRPELYWGDKLHLSSQGYVVWAQTMNVIFNRILKTPFPSKVVWMGDSLSYRWQTTGLPVWNTNYRDLQTNNLARDSDTTEDTLDLIENQNVLDGLNPKVAVLLVGGNDLLGGAQAPQVIANIERILEHFHDKFAHARILLLGLLPAAGIPEEIVEQGKIINAALEAMHNGDDLHYLDMRHEFADENEVVYPELYDPDGIHLSLQGYNVWFTTMEPIFHELLEFDN